MDFKNKTTIFHPQLSYPQRRRYGCTNNCCVSNCDGVLNKAKDIELFCAALGYTDEIRQARNMIIDEFIFDEYIGCGAPQSQATLQVKVVKYLTERCEMFKANL